MNFNYEIDISNIFNKCNELTYSISDNVWSGQSKENFLKQFENFINDNIKLGNKKIVIVHGKGEGIVKEELHFILKNDKRVKRYYLDMFNIGETIIELN